MHINQNYKIKEKQKNVQNLEAFANQKLIVL